MGETTLKPIADGVSLCAVQTDRFKTCKIVMYMALPLEGDIAAAAVLPYILRRSCRKYPDFTALNGHLDMLYGAVLGASVAKKGEAQILHLSISAIDDRFAIDGGGTAREAAQLLLDLLFDPKLENGTFAASEVETEKRLLLERMRSEDDDKRTYALRRCQEVMCGGEAFGRNRYGTAEEIESLTSARVYAAWRRVLEQAVIRVVMVSSGTDEAVQQTITTRFLPAPEGDVKTVRETQPLKQGTLVLGLRCGMRDCDDMDPTMLVMNDMFGGGVYSKLFTVVREKMSLCYYCRSLFNRDKGILLIPAGIETDNQEKTTDAVLAQLAEMQNGTFTRELFEMSVRAMTDSIREYTDLPDALCSYYGSQIFRDSVKTTDERIAEIRAVKFEDLQHAAQQIRLDTIFMLAGTGAENDA